ncbi:hypothetical protein LCGC14_2191320, partial [marine sediment metagenome]
MDQFSFKKAVDIQYEARVKATAPIKEVDAYIFCTSSKYLGERLFPFQSLLIKVIYGLWQKYPLNEDEQKVVDIMKNVWGIDWKLADRDPAKFVEILILVLGRRSGKSSLISFIQTYEAYKLICKGDPQAYYSIRRRHPIWIVNCAKDGSQAQDPFRLCKDNIRRIPFFEKFVDWSKDNSEELRLFTPADIYENAQIQKYNSRRPKGSAKKNLLEGSIMIAAFTTSAASKRGKAIICLILDEFAHFERTKTVGGGATEEDILAEMPQTDYAMLKALSPSTKDFIMADKVIFDGKVIMISSPREKGGEFYRNYCFAGGSEQTGAIAEEINDNYLLMQLATWECNPKYPREVFDSDFKKDPVGANMEYGAHFGEPSTSFIDSARIDEMVKEHICMAYVGQWQRQYIISVDPASKSDTYAVTWGHVEHDIVVIDGIQGFRPKVVHNKVTGKIVQVPVKAGDVVKFIKALAARLCYQGVLLEIVFDQWNSQESITTLKNAGYVALETFFSNKYKNAMYTNFLEKLNMGAVHCFSQPPEFTFNEAPIYLEGWLDQLKLELKYLTKTIKGDIVKYGHPDSGPIQTDDFADVVANLVYRHGLYQSGDRQVYKDLYKQTGRPIRHQSTGVAGRRIPG